MSNTKERINKIVEKINQIPTLPMVSQKIMELVGDENASFKKIVELVESDQAVAVSLLKLANSAFYGFLGKVSSVEHALALLGGKEVKSVLLGISIHNFFSESDGNGFDRSRFWQHAIVSSQVAKLLGKRFHVKDDDTLFLSGLVHDIGKVVLDQYLHEEFMEIVDLVASKHSTFSAAEKQVLGVTHYQIAAKLLERWRLPKRVIMQVLYHHAPWHDQTYLSNSITIYLANTLTKLAGYPCHPQEKEINLQQFVDSRELAFIVKSGFDIDSSTIKNLIAHIQEFVVIEADNVLNLFK